MTIEILCTFLLCSLGIAYALLVVWFAVLLLAHDALYRLHARWFPALSRESFDAIHYAGMAAFKIAALLLFAVPWLALGCVG
jgi:NO-binding membrane sensor protein with MHYT domain